MSNHKWAVAYQDTAVHKMVLCGRVCSACGAREIMDMTTRVLIIDVVNCETKQKEQRKAAPDSIGKRYIDAHPHRLKVKLK